MDSVKVKKKPDTPTATRTIKCPVCGTDIPILSVLGRKPLNISVKNVYDSLRNTRSIRASAEKLLCSRGYIYGVLKKRGVTLEEVLETLKEVRGNGRD
jgi:hypothetical protein